MTTTCDAGTVGFELSASGYGMDRIPCRQSVGLRSFIDMKGETRHYCSAEGHRHQAIRRYGEAQPPEPDWNMPESADPVTAAKGMTETERRFAWGDR